MKSVYPYPFSKLIKLLQKLPGIGPKTAERLAFYLIRAPEEEVRSLSCALAELHQKVIFCKRCFNLSEEELCNICKDTTRDNSILCVVATWEDLFAIEASNVFNGKYHILGGLLSPIDGIGPDELNIKKLLDRLAEENVKEIIIATSFNLAGEATATYIQELLKDYPVKVTRLASGIPTGAELGYVDEYTLGKALEGRHLLSL